MSKTSSRLGRPGSAGSKNFSSRKDLQGNRSCMLRIGERLMRAGSEGNLAQRPFPTSSHNQNKASGLGQGPHGASKVDVAADKDTEPAENNCSEVHVPSVVPTASTVHREAEHQLPKKSHTNNLIYNPRGVPSSHSTLPRSDAAASSRESELANLLMQHSEVERKKGVFLDHLRQKYPHHADIIIGHQEHMKEQLRSPRPSESTTCDSVLAAEDMSDGESLPLTVPFSRGCKARSSLPVGRSSGQPRESLGVLYLQYGDETKQIRMPAEINSEDALRALFVAAFPQQLTTKMLQSPSMAIYIKDTRRNVYFDLEDVRNITSHSCLKVYHKDPSHVFNRHARPATTEGRISKQVLYGSHSPVHTLSSSSRGTLQCSMSPPMVRSMPSSPSRMAYGGRSTQSRVGVMDAGSATLLRDRLAGAGRSSSTCSSSAILERRDVKPDEDVGNSKSMALVVRTEGGPYYPESYSSYASYQCSAPASLAADMADTEITGIPAGLQQYRASIKPLVGYGDGMDHQTQSLHRQKARKYSDSQLPPFGTKTPPPSPHRVNEVKMSEGQIIGGVGLVSPERMSPIRCSLRRESNGVPVEMMNRSRGSGSSSSTSSVFVDCQPGQSERLLQGHMTAFDTQSERMKAMEEQIASLAGLVHHALSMGGDHPRVKSLVSESREKNRPVPAQSQVMSALTDKAGSTSLALQALPTDSEMQHSLVQVKRNVSELRLQLNQLRNLQVSHQHMMRSMLRMADQELVLLMSDRLSQSEERTCGRKAEIEEERLHYLATEERILKQLSDLEDYVNHLQTSTVSFPGQLPIALRDVEEGAVNLRRVGETLAVLKEEFPELQVKMRSVLRLEMDAVRFLKEEPHKMDSMLKRVKALTEALSSLRRSVSESTPPTRASQVESGKALQADQEPQMQKSPNTSPKPQPRSSFRGPLPIPPSNLTQPELNFVGSGSPVTARRVKTTAATVIHAHQHSPPLTPTHGRDLPTVAKVSPRSREGSPALQKPPGPLQSSELHRSSVPTESHAANQVQTSLKSTAKPTESAVREASEGSLESSSVSQPNTSHDSNITKDLDQVLQDAQASLMKSIPDLDLSHTGVGQSDLAAADINPSTSKKEMEKPLDLTLQASLSGTQEHKQTQQSDEVDSPLLKPPAAAVTVEPPTSASPSASPGTRRSTRPQVEKPRRSSVEKKQSPDRSHFSPTPPKRLHAASTALTTGRSGEVIFTTRKEPVGSQDVGEKEPSVIPQPKPPRQPPEVKPKPTNLPATEHMDDEDDKKFLKELQVTAETSSNTLPSEKDILGVQQKTHTESKVADQNHFLTMNTNSTPHSGPPIGCPDNHLKAEVIKSGQGCVAPHQVEEGKMVKQESMSNVMQMLPSVVPPNAASKNAQVSNRLLTRENVEMIPNPDKDDACNMAVRCDLETLCSSTEIKTLTTIVPLQDVLPTDTVTAKVDKYAEYSFSVQTLQKQQTIDDCVQELPAGKHDTSGNLERNKLHFPEVNLQLSEGGGRSTEEGSLSPDILDDGGSPPPLLPAGKISLCIARNRIRALSKEQDPDNRNVSDITTAVSGQTEQPICQVYENQAFEDNCGSDNDPVDIQSDFKRLSTIFECEEDLVCMVSPDSLVEEATTQEYINEDLKQVFKENTSLGFNISENGQHSLLNMLQTDGSVDEKQESKSDVLKKAETKFKFKFPKNKLAAIGQAIRSGPTKTGKKTPEVAVPKEEEMMTLGQKPVKETKKLSKRSSRFRTARTKQDPNHDKLIEISPSSPNATQQVFKPKSHSQVEDLCKKTFDSIDSLDESIKRLEISMDSFRSSSFSKAPSPPALPDSSSSDSAHPSRKVKQQREGSPSKRPASQIFTSPNFPQTKRVKPQPAN
ncbi:sickle tail protein-like [Dunckerocampus dactyliophorus]|uniref:sickle tail protein-like n=1 Tax=Dunckerocampus dactyliophorus TaxID=161453 RepID=UPI002404996C|nr:sickle tail protein-like [Dunckerocampus dactyliophorus]